MKRIHVVLASLLAVQIGLIFVTHSSRGDHALSKLKPVLPGLDSDQVTRLEIIDGEGEETIVLEKKSGAWVLASHQDYPALPSKISSALAALSGAESRRPVARGKERFVQLGVAEDDYVRKLIVNARDATHTVFVGNPAGRGKTALRVSESEAIHGQSGVRPSTFQARASAWVDSSYLDIEEDQIESIEVSNAGGTFLIERGDETRVTANGKALGTAPGQEFDEALIDRLTQNARKITLKEPVAPLDKDAPIATVIVRTVTKSDGQPGDEFTIDYYKRGEDSVVHDRQRQHWIKVAASQVEPFVELEEENLLKAVESPDEPVAGDGPS